MHSWNSRDHHNITIHHDGAVHSERDGSLVHIYGVNPTTDRTVYARNILYTDLLQAAYENRYMIVTDEEDRDAELTIHAEVIRRFIGTMVCYDHISQLENMDPADYYRRYVYPTTSK